MGEKTDHQDYLAQHKHDVIWQIWLPIGFGAIAMFALGLLAAFSLRGGTEASVRWSQVATIWLILPIFVAGVFLFVLLTGLVFLVSRLKSVLPDYAMIFQYYAQMIADRIKSAADKSARPVITARAYKSAANRFWLALRYLLAGGYRD